MKNPLDLFDPATDWIRHPLHERLIMCAQLLYVRGYMSRSSFHTTLSRLTRDLDRAGELRAKGASDA